MMKKDEGNRKVLDRSFKNGQDGGSGDKITLVLVATILDQYWSILLQYWTNIGQLFFATRV
jgi:hypothetical protein